MYCVYIVILSDFLFWIYFVLSSWFTLHWVKDTFKIIWKLKSCEVWAKLARSNISELICHKAILQLVDNDNVFKSFLVFLSLIFCLKPQAVYFTVQKTLFKKKSLKLFLANNIPIFFTDFCKMIWMKNLQYNFKFILFIKSIQFRYLKLTSVFKI